MNNNLITFLCAGSVAGVLFTIGCGQKSEPASSGEPRAMERTGAALDRAAVKTREVATNVVEKTSEAASAAAAATKEAAQKTVEKTGEVIEKTGKALEKTGDSMQ
jgi:hypothetical protein